MVPKHPAIVGAVADHDTLVALPDLIQSVLRCDFIEFRIDALMENDDLLIRRLADCPRPILITVRDPAEGGQNALSAHDRRQRMLELLPHATLLDIEIRNLEAFSGVVATAKSTGVGVVASFHDFEGTPSAGRLREVVAQGRANGADLIKLAVTTHTVDDLHTLIAVHEEERVAGPMTVMGMGKLGLSSRVVAAESGALLTYTYLKEANAPGQWSADGMRHLFHELGIPQMDESMKI